MIRSLSLKQNHLVTFALALLIGGALLHRAGSDQKTSDIDMLTVRQSEEQQQVMSGHFSAHAVRRYAFDQSGQSLFNLQVAHYLDEQGGPRSVILFPENSSAETITLSPTGLRHDIWRETTRIIIEKAPENALFVSWWDDGQRIHFLSGRQSWLHKPPSLSVESPYWRTLRADMPKTDAEQKKRLTQMARWLTMDSDEAVREIIDTFGDAGSVYLLITTDLLLHLPEIGALAGKTLALQSGRIAAGDNLHGDIARVKRWAYEHGDGNYLVQKEIHHYRVYSDAISSKNSLLVRLLPFVDSLKQLPEHVTLVYQSRWGAFLSIYRIGPPINDE